MEVEARVKALAYKVKGMSRESASQKATHVLDADLRTHWSTATNTKEWILLELNVIIFFFYHFYFYFLGLLGLYLANSSIQNCHFGRSLACFLTFGFTTSRFSNGKFQLVCATRLAYLSSNFLLLGLYLSNSCFALLSTARNICESTSPL